MGSGRYLDDPLTFTRNPPSSPITVSNHLDSFLGESTSRSGSFESESISDADFGPEKLVGTVHFYERHVFLCYKKPSVWPARIEASEFDRLPRLLSSVVLARKSDMKKEVICIIVPLMLNPRIRSPFDVNPRIRVISNGLRSDHFCNLIHWFVILTWGDLK